MLERCDEGRSSVPSLCAISISPSEVVEGYTREGIVVAAVDATLFARVGVYDRCGVLAIDDGGAGTSARDSV